MYVVYWIFMLLLSDGYPEKLQGRLGDLINQFWISIVRGMLSGITTLTVFAQMKLNWIFWAKDLRDSNIYKF